MIVIIVFQTEHKKYGPRYEVLGYCISSSSDGGGDPTSTVSAYFFTLCKCFFVILTNIRFLLTFTLKRLVLNLFKDKHSTSTGLPMASEDCSGLCFIFVVINV